MTPLRRTGFTPKPSWKPMNRGKGMSARRNPLPAVSDARKRLKGLNRVSKRRQRVGATYRAFRVSHLAGHPRCEVRGGSCTGSATDIHHVRSRGRSGRDADLVDPGNVLAVCRSCHDWIETHRLESLERGWLRKARPDAERWEG